MGSWLFGSAKGTANDPQPPASSMRFQTSIQGKPLPLLAGQNRVAGNLIWYGDFYAMPIFQSSGGGGKGGATGGGGKGGSQGSVTYEYHVSVAIAFCQGPVEVADGSLLCWNNKSVGYIAGLGFTTFAGDYTQSPWGYLSAAHPDQARAYRGIAYMVQSALNLGSVTELPNISVEVRSTISYGIAGRPDADPKDWVVDLLTNAYYGAGFPTARLDTLMTQASAYWRATGLLISPVLMEQKEASGYLADVLKAVNASPRWSGGVLSIIPWGDAEVTGNGVTYTPDVTPLYDITEDDLLPGDDGGPIKVTRRRKADMINDMMLEYLDRSSSYNPVAIDVKDQASIDIYGLRTSDLKTCHFFCVADTAVLSATLQLGREQIPNEYTFTLGPKFILPDVEDILTLTREEMGLYRQPVRIVDIEEQDDGSLTFVCEDFMGTASAPLYGTEAPDGHETNTNEDPGEINAPLIFEPTAQLLGGDTLEVWGAVSGVDTTIWGGCNVYASFDGVTYKLMDSRVLGPGRMGLLTAQLPSVAVNVTGPTIDATNTLSVDLSESASSLQSGSDADVTALATACYVDGEIIAYKTATLTGDNAYDLDYLVRGAYGTESLIATHEIGSAFARLDQGIFKVAFEQNQIGQTVYLKFQGFNVWGGGLQELSDLAAFPYVLQGTALKSPLDTVENVRTVYEAGFQKMWWDDVVDFRTGIRYKIFKGDTYEGAEQVFDSAHPPFIAFGTGTYWIVAYCQPTPGLYVYSEDPVSITISGNMLIKNLVYESDQGAAGWPGIFSNGVGPDGSSIRLGGSGDILTAPDFLTIPDVLSYGGIISEGTYEVASTDYINVGYLADCYVNASWKAIGSPVGQDILTVEDFLAMVDVLGAASTQYVNVKVQIAIAETDTPGDLYDATDLYAEGDLYYSGVAWSDWQDFVPGVYRAWLIKFRLVLTSIDSNTICYCPYFAFQASVPARIDHYPNLTVPAAGLTVTYEPDDASTASPFNGGPPVGGVANQPYPFLNFAVVGQAGLTPVIDSQSLSEVTFHFETSGGVATTVNDCSLQAEGY